MQFFSIAHLHEALCQSEDIVRREVHVQYNKNPYRIAPGSTVTKAPTIDVATGKTLGSNILIEPPAKGVAGASDSAKEKACGTTPFGSEGAVSFFAGGSVALCQNHGPHGNNEISSCRKGIYKAARMGYGRRPRCPSGSPLREPPSVCAQSNQSARMSHPR